MNPSEPDMDPWKEWKKTRGGKPRDILAIVHLEEGTIYEKSFDPSTGEVTFDEDDFTGLVVGLSVEDCYKHWWPHPYVKTNENKLTVHFEGSATFPVWEMVEKEVMMVHICEKKKLPLLMGLFGTVTGQRTWQKALKDL